MANPFDRFDAPTPPATAANPFDRFDSPTPQADTPSVARDVVQSGAIGLAKGAIGLPGLPGDMQMMGNSLVDRLMLSLGHGVMDLTGLGPQAGTPQREEFDRLYTGIGSASNLPTGADLQGQVERATGAFYKPQTTAGHYAQTIGEFAPAAVVGPGGLVRKTAGVVVPAVASETAGQLAKGTKLEPIARLGGALAGNLGAGAAGARSSAPERAINTAANRVTPDQFDAARAVQETGARVGVPLTGPEAIQQATGNATKLSDVQRFVEGSPQGAALTEMMAARPGQMQTAVGNTLDVIAPQNLNPSTIGPRAAEAATNELEVVRRGINDATRPAYRAAEQHVLDPAAFDPISRDPAFQASLRRLRNDEVLGPAYAGQPDNAVGVIDAVTKDMRDRGVALGNAANPGFSSQTSGMYGSGAAEARDIARTPARGGVQAYDDALTMQEQARRQNLAPLEQGPLGEIAGSTNGRGNLSSTQAVGRTVLPPTPLAGGERELVDTIMRLERQDPGLPGQVVRQRLADQADQSMTRLVGGEAQGGGAKFAKDIAGTRQQEENLLSVIAALPNGSAARQRMEEVLAVFRATGTRKPQGSPTDMFTQYRNELSDGSLSRQALTAARTGGASLLTSAGDASKRAWLGRGNERLAQTFAAPDSVDRIAGIVRRGVETPYADALVRMVMQGPRAAVYEAGP